MKMKNTNKGNKPDFKTESLEVIKRYGGTPTKEEFIVKVKTDDEISNTEDELVIYDNEKIQISSVGFKRVIKDNKLIFAYQLKLNEGICIIHIPNGTTGENLEKIEKLLIRLKENMNNNDNDIIFMSSEEYISPILNEIGTLININSEDK